MYLFNVIKYNIYVCQEDVIYKFVFKGFYVQEILWLKNVNFQIINKIKIKISLVDKTVLSSIVKMFVFIFCIQFGAIIT